MSTVKSLAESVSYALDCFGTLTGKSETMVPTGIKAVDDTIGGVLPGFCCVVGMYNSVGKSSLIMHAALQSSVKVGIVSTEDTPDVWGSRLIAAYSGVNSLKVRTGHLREDERKKVLKAQERAREEKGVEISYVIGKDLERKHNRVGVLDGVRELLDSGCKVIWLDYLQKIKGTREDRRNEISYAYTKFQEVCSDGNAVPIVMSQFARKQITEGKSYRDASMYDRPEMSWLKESGDIENEARLIILGHRDKLEKSVVQCRLAKSTLGAVGTEFAYKFNSAGVLEEYKNGKKDDDLGF